MTQANDFKSQLEEAIFQIQREVFSMDNHMNLDYRQYYILPVSIKRIVLEEKGPSIAELKVNIVKSTAKCIMNYHNSDGSLKETKTQKFTEWYEYWLLGTKQYLKANLNLSEKAIVLQEFIEDVKRNFPDCLHAKKIVELASKLHDTLSDRANADKDEKEYYPLTISKAQAQKEGLPKINSIYAINLRKAIHLKKDNYEKIKKHEEEKKFDKGIPLEMDIVTYILIE